MVQIAGKVARKNNNKRNNYNRDLAMWDLAMFGSVLMLIIMIIHLFPGAFQDTRGRLAKQSGKRDNHMSMG